MKDAAGAVILSMRCRYSYYHYSAWRNKGVPSRNVTPLRKSIGVFRDGTMVAI